MNFVTFGNETINLDNVTHITMDTRKRDGGIGVPFIRFNFVNSEESLIFQMVDWDNEVVPAYHQAKAWLENLQERKPS